MNNLELLKILSNLSPKAKLCLAGIGIVAYLGLNGFMAYNASKNGQGFENSILRIKIMPKEQEKTHTAQAVSQQAAVQVTAAPKAKTAAGTAV